VIRPPVDLGAIQHATAAMQAARHDADFHDHESLRQLLVGTVEETLADDGRDFLALRRLVLRVHNCFRQVDSVVSVTTASMQGLLDTIELQTAYINWVEGGKGDPNHEHRPSDE